MTNRIAGLAAAAVLSIATPATGVSVLAAQEPARLAFGYQCDNRFALRNEGTKPVEVEYVVLGSAEKGKVHLDPDQGVSLEPKAGGDLEIRVDGKAVATGRNGHVACAAQASQTVIVRPLNEPQYVTIVEPYYPPYPYPYYYNPYYYGPRLGIYMGIGGGWYGGRVHGGRIYGGHRGRR
jgi:hypothetical protein